MYRSPRGNKALDHRDTSRKPVPFSGHQAVHTEVVPEQLDQPLHVYGRERTDPWIIPGTLSLVVTSEPARRIHIGSYLCVNSLHDRRPAQHRGVVIRVLHFEKCWIVASTQSGPLEFFDVSIPYHWAYLPPQLDTQYRAAYPNLDNVLNTLYPVFKPLDLSPVTRPNAVRNVEGFPPSVHVDNDHRRYEHNTPREGLREAANTSSLKWINVKYRS